MKIKSLRYPKTANEIRANLTVIADTEVLEVSLNLVRSKRLNLPTNRNDINRLTVKSWKEYRNTQYYR